MSDTKPDTTTPRGINYAKAFRPEPCDLRDANQTANFIAKCTNWVVAAKIDSLEDRLILCLNLLTGDAAVWATAHIQTIGNHKMAIADHELEIPEHGVNGQEWQIRVSIYWVFLEIKIKNLKK